MAQVRGAAFLPRLLRRIATGVPLFFFPTSAIFRWKKLSLPLKGEERVAEDYRYTGFSLVLCALSFCLKMPRTCNDYTGG